MTKTRKELKEEYKQMKFKIGIFLLRNIVNDKIFIDSSMDLVSIWNRQRMELNFGSHPNLSLQKDWNKFGADKFEYEIVSQIKQSETEIRDYKKELKLLEEMYLEKLQPYDDKGYNRKPKN